MENKFYCYFWLNFDRCLWISLGEQTLNLNIKGKNCDYKHHDCTLVQKTGKKHHFP